MYIISIDLGSTNYKAIVIKVDKNEFKLIGKVKMKNMDFALFISSILEKYSIKENEIEMLIATGTGSSFIEIDKYKYNIKIINEFDAIAYGGLLLSKLDKALIVSIGTGTSIVYTDLNENKHIGGTGLGGGTFMGLGRLLVSNNNKDLNFFDLLEIAKKGDRTQVDLMIEDINKGDIGNLTKGITAANFAALDKTPSINDYIAGVANMITETIGLMVKGLNDYKLPVVFVGTMVTEKFIQELLLRTSDFTGDKYVFIDDAEYAISIGAYEYYLLRLRTNI